MANTSTTSKTSKTTMPHTGKLFQNPIIEEIHAVREQLWLQAGENYATAIARAHESTKTISATMRHIKSQPRRVTGWQTSVSVVSRL